MDPDILRSGLEQVASELAAARTEYASLGAKIAGLEARRAVLAKAIPGAQSPGLTIFNSGGY
jgi:BMFP domain-containing protein YqiC